MFDTHVHTTFSSDSKMSVGEVLDFINKKDIGIILTEHLDLNYPDESMFKLDIDSYVKNSEKFKSNKLLVGIEIGFDEDTFVNECKRVEKSYDFDFVLGSTHIVEGIDLYEDEYYKNIHTNELYSIESVYDRYFNAMLRLIKINPYFDSMAHIDYISRYAKRYHSDSEIHYEQYSYIIDKILKELAEMNKAIEINTRRLNEKGTGENLIKIYKRFRELGGKFVTIGSDSHDKDSIAINFNKALEIADKSGLEPVYFKERKRIKF